MIAASTIARWALAIVEMTDDIGKQLTYAALEKQGMPRHEIPELIASYCKNAIPTFKAVVTFETALKILPLTSESAEQNLKGPRRAGTHWIVIVGGDARPVKGSVIKLFHANLSKQQVSVTATQTIPEVYHAINKR